MLSINLGNQERNIRFDFNSLCDLEEKAKMGISKLMEEFAGFNVLRLLIWAGNKHENRGLTLDMVGLWIQDFLENDGTLEELYTKVLDELMNSGVMGKQKKVAKGK